VKAALSSTTGATREKQHDREANRLTRCCICILRARMSQDALGSSVSGPRAASMSPRLHLLASRVRSALGIAVYVALWGWAIDVYSVARQGQGTAHVPGSELVRGLGAALFRALLLTLLPALAIGVLRWLAELQRQWSKKPPLTQRISAYLREGTPIEQLSRAGLVVALGPALAASLGACVLICERLITGMARPLFAAMACVASCSIVLLIAAITLPSAAALGSMFCAALSRLPVVGARFFSRAWQLALFVLVAACVALAYALYRFREPLGFLPWPTILQLLAALAAGLLTAWLATRLPRRTRKLRLLIGLAIVTTACALAITQRATAVQSRQIAERDTVLGHLGQSLLLWAWDRDRDGYLPMFGGGDCAPREATRNPGATEIPGNQIDEDCDGEDLDPKATALRGKYDYPVPQAIPSRPPLVLITVDAFAASHMHALGYPREITPNIDRLAARSVFFRQCYAQGPSTRLSFPSLFASRWDTQIEQELTGHHPFPISKHEKLLAEVLQTAGYDTAAVLSDGYFSPRFWRGITRGFRQIIETPFAGAHVPHNGERVTEAALKAIEEQRDKPLFLWAHYYDAHSPHQQPEGVSVFGTSRKDVYDAELNLVDREVGKLLAAIERKWQGQAVVVLTGDHGIAFDEPRHAKFNYGYDLYSSVLHVPLIVHAPFLQARSLDSPVSTMDIAPTLANLLRLRGPLPYEGVSLLPELFKGEVSRPPELMHQMFIEERKWKHEEPLERVSLRTDRWNLLQDRKTGFLELYDYRNDYWETQDLALDPRYSETLAQLRKQLTILLFNATPPTPPTPPQAKK
jgi:arylsulfatase A-like enzyme